MKDEDNTKERLIKELKELRKQNSELETLVITHKKTVERISKSKELFEKTFKSQIDAIFILDAKKPPIIIDCNSAATRIFGYSRQEMLARTTDFLHVDEVSLRKFQEILNSAIAEQGFIHLPYFQMRKKDNTVFPTEHSVMPLLDNQGRRNGWVSAVRDISERKKTEEALDEERKLLRTLMDNLPDYIYVKDTQSRFITTNAAHLQLLGAEKLEEVIGKTDFAFFPGELAEQYYADEQEVIKSDRPLLNRVEQVIDQEGRRKWLLTTKVPLHDSSGSVVGIVGMGRDITELRQAEEALRESEERFRTIVETTPGFLLIDDAKGNAIYVSPNCKEITGYTQEELLGESIWWVHEEDMQRAKELYDRVSETGEGVRNFEYKAVKKNREVRYFSSSWEQLRDKKGEFKGLILQTIDITERKQVEEERIKSSKLESIGILAGGIAHDFNNILTAIIGNISLAKMDMTPGEEIYDMLTEAEKASMQAKDLTQQLLTFSKGGAPVKKTTLITGLIKETSIFALRGSKVKCRYSIPKDIWPVEIDEGQMSQVINNLIINADQAMPEGGIIEVQAENMTAGAEHNIPLKEEKYIKISIKDQGIGVSQEHLSKIFDPYFTTKQKGSGLGLTTAYSIVKSHAGYITSESELGLGTTFYIYLPASPKEIITEEKVEEKPLAGKGKILVMDDEQMVREVAGKILKSIGYDVVYAKDGAEATELYKRAKESDQSFDAVIMDLTVPGGMGGREAIKRLLEIDPEAKVIVSSGYSNDPIMSEYKKYSFSGVITKPYKLMELSKIVKSLFFESQNEIG